MKFTPEEIAESVEAFRQAMETGSLCDLEVCVGPGIWEPKGYQAFCPDTLYRRKPQPKLIPYTAETWPLDAGWVKFNGTFPTRVIDILSSGIRIGNCNDRVEFVELLKNATLTRDNGKTWEPCGHVTT